MNSAKLNKRRQPNTQYVLSLSYGKDSLTCLEAIKQLGYPLDRIVHAEVWATDDIPADLPPMVEFKAYADKIIKERYGIDVEHVCAMCTEDKKYKGNFTNPPIGAGGGTNSPMKICSTDTSITESIPRTSRASQWQQDNGVKNLSSKPLKNCKLTYQDLFYRPIKSDKTLSAQRGGVYRGFPTRQSQYCTSECKRAAMRQVGLPKQSKTDAVVYGAAQSQSANNRFFGYAPRHRGQNKYCDISWDSL